MNDAASRNQIINRGESIRYPSASGSSSTALSVVPGHLESSSTIDSAEPPLPLKPLGQFRGFSAQFGALSSAGDNDTFNYAIYGVRRIYETTRALLGIETVYVGGGVATLGGSVFIGGTAAATSGRLADGLTWTISSESTTPRGPMTALETAVGSGGSRVFNPANDLAPAELIVPDFWWPELAIEFDSVTGSPLGMFALVSFF